MSCIIITTAPCLYVTAIHVLLDACNNNLQALKRSHLDVTSNCTARCIAEFQQHRTMTHSTCHKALICLILRVTHVVWQHHSVHLAIVPLVLHVTRPRRTDLTHPVTDLTFIVVTIYAVARWLSVRRICFYHGHHAFPTAFRCVQ